MFRDGLVVSEIGGGVPRWAVVAVLRDGWPWCSEGVFGWWYSEMGSPRWVVGCKVGSRHGIEGWWCCKSNGRTGERSNGRRWEGEGGVEISNRKKKDKETHGEFLRFPGCGFVFVDAGGRCLPAGCISNRINRKKKKRRTWTLFLPFHPLHASY